MASKSDIEVWRDICRIARASVGDCVIARHVIFCIGGSVAYLAFASKSTHIICTGVADDATQRYKSSTLDILSVVSPGAEHWLMASSS